MTPTRSRRRLWLLVPVVLALVVVGGVAWAHVDTRPRADAGQLFDPELGQEELNDGVEVVLPWARVGVAVGKPRSELPDSLGAEPNLRSPDGGTFVQLQVTVDSEDLIPLYVDSPGFAGRADLTLVDGDHRYPLTHVPGGLRLDPATADIGSSQRFLAVAGSPDHWSLEVEYDGLTWVVDLDDGSSDPGPQDALADLPGLDASEQQHGMKCGTPRWSDRFGPEEPWNQPNCKLLHLMRVPYVDGLGWAEPGREFLVVQVQSYEPGHVSGPGGAAYFVSAPEMSYRLDGRRSLAVAEVNDLDTGPLALELPYDPDQAVFDVAVDDSEPMLQVRQSLVGEARERGIPQAPRFHIDWRIPLKGV